MIASLSLLMILGAGMTAGPVETVEEGFMFTEGPLWLPDGSLLFSDIPADRIYQIKDGEKSVFREPSGQSNGLTLDNEGRLLAAEHQNRRVSRTEKDGSITVLADKFEGKRLNSPNDVVVRSDGTVFFTDPPYGLKGGLGGDDAELDFSGVYAIKTDKSVVALVKDFVRPNGLALSPDEKTLYVADTQEKRIRAFDLATDGTVSNDRLFYELPSPDGMKADTQGNVWCTANDGVHVISPKGEGIEVIAFPKHPANCAFGGPDYKTLYATCRQHVYKVPISVQGIAPGTKRAE